MLIKIDIREQDLFAQMNILISTIPLFKDIKIVKENLALGDIIIVDEEKGEEKIIIERKSINDLVSSIKDGRYKEQSYRLNGLSHPNHNIIYLIEGDVNKMNRFKDVKMEKLTIYSAIFSLNYFKGFSVIRTFTIEESAIFICNTLIKLIASSDKKPYYTNQTDQTSHSIEEDGTEKDYVSVIKKVKKENITPENIGEIMLCQIPGVSSVTALSVMDKFKTISNLIKEIEKDETCLNNICTVSGTKSRKINKNAIVAIINNLVKK